MSRYDNFSEDYEKYRVEYPEEFIEFIKKEFDMNINKTYCDLGCGTGKFTKRIIEFSKEIDGVDLSQGMLEIARKMGNKFNPIKCDANEFKRKNKYAIIFISHSFHWMDSDKVLNNSELSLEKGGKIAIFWNNSLDRKKKYYNRIQTLVKKYHDKPISMHRGLDTIQKLEKTNRFRKIEHKKFQFQINYTIEEYLGLLKSKSYVSDDIPQESHEEFFNKAKKILLEEGNIITEHFVTDLYYGEKIN